MPATAIRVPRDPTGTRRGTPGTGAGAPAAAPAGRGLLLACALLARRALGAADAGEGGGGGDLECRADEVGCGDAADRHHWPLFRGRVGEYGRTAEVVPKDLSSALAWSWHHPGGRYHDVLLGGPNIDEQRFLYVTMTKGIYKLSPDGLVLWVHEPSPGSYFTCTSALMGNALFTNQVDGIVFALDIQTGKELWKRKVSNSIGSDTAYPQAYRGLFLTAVDAGSDAGNHRIVALNSSTGDLVWDYRSSRLLWNFSPMFPDAESLVTMDVHGGVYRLGLRNGSLLWYTPPPPPFQFSFSDGFVSLSPDGAVAYACADLEHGQIGSQGSLRAYRVSDGRELWSRILQHPCTTWVASDASTVYVAHGPLPGFPGVTQTRWPDFMKPFLYHLSIALGPWQRFLWWSGIHRSEVWALRASDGAVLWRYEAPPWYEPSCRGDNEGLPFRRVLTPHRAICATACWGSSTLDGNGTLLTPHMDGRLYAIKDANGDGVIDPSTEVQTFEDRAGGSASLHFGTAFAPGMMGFSTCDTLYVFKW